MVKFFEGLGEQLSLFARHLAWLQATPKPRASKFRTLAEEQEDEPVSRIQQMLNDGVEVELPPVAAPWLADIFMEIGPVEASAMGAAPLSWREIASWQETAGHPLTPWEAKTMRELSNVYLAESQRAEDPRCPAPWVNPTSEANRAAVVRKIAALFGGRVRR